MQSSYDLYLEKCSDFCYENFYAELSFIKKEALFAAYFLPLLNLSRYPISHQAIQKQLENIKSGNDYDTYSQKAKELYRETFFNGVFSFSLLQTKEDWDTIGVVQHCFINELEQDDLMMEYTCGSLSLLGFPQELLLDKLKIFFGELGRFEEIDPTTMEAIMSYVAAVSRYHKKNVIGTEKALDFLKIEVTFMIDVILNEESYISNLPIPTNYAERYIDIQKENLQKEDFLLRSKCLREEILSEIYKTSKPALDNSYIRDTLMAFMSIFPFSLEQDGALIKIFTTYYTKTFFVRKTSLLFFSKAKGTIFVEKSSGYIAFDDYLLYICGLKKE